jgi:hypothetical protein
MKYAARSVLSSALLALVVASAVAGCGSSGSNTTGAAGTTGQAGSGAAGTTGAAGSTTGAAGTGAAGSTTGAAGTGAAGTGAAGTGAAGTGAAGTGAAGTGAAGTGAAGTGAAGTGAAGTGAAGTGAAGAGAAGTGAAGTGAAGTGAAGAGAKQAVAMIAPLPNGTIMGTATFTQNGNDVTLQVDLTNCPMGVHGIHIHAGSACTSEATQGMHWAPPRGEMIGTASSEITCDAQMKGTLTYTRMGTQANLKWTIGDGSATDVIGHPVVVHGVNGSTARHGCGVIMMK